jgi:hypothetical protein
MNKFFFFFFCFKSTLERKQARQKCMENRLRLGQFVTQRQGATFVENWTDGIAFTDISKYVEFICLIKILIFLKLKTTRNDSTCSRRT